MYWIQEKSPCNCPWERMDEVFHSLTDALESRDRLTDQIPAHLRDTHKGYRVVDADGTVYEYTTQGVTR